MKLEYALPKGYRWLRFGEKKQAGDLYPKDSARQWRPTLDIGGFVLVSKHYIRRIKKASK